jgi:hypothetical protein
MKYKSIYLWFILVSFFSGEPAAQTYERGRQESGTYKVYKETAFEIYNKYGNIHLFSWDKDSVKIEVSLQVKAGKQSKVDKIYEYIDFEFTHSKYYVIARTNLDPQSAFWAEVSDLTNSFFSSTSRIQIDYDIYLPQWISIKIENKFGNIYLQDHIGKAFISQSNGDFRANDLKGSSQVEVSFGNATINSLNNGNLNLNYAAVDLIKTTDLRVESKSSTINIETAGVLQINSRRDKFQIGQLTSMDGTGSFTHIIVRRLLSGMNLKTDYGSLTIESMNHEFKSFDLNSTYTDILLRMPAGFSFPAEITHSSSTVITSPESYNGLKWEEVDKKADLYRTAGSAGSGVLKRGKLTINAKSGKISFRDELK